MVLSGAESPRSSASIRLLKTCIVHSNRNAPYHRRDNNGSIMIAKQRNHTHITPPIAQSITIFLEKWPALRRLPNRSSVRRGNLYAMN